MLQWMVGANHLADAEEITHLAAALMQAAFWSGLIWLFYVAIEPYVRRNWPEALISWTRLQSGQLRDPLVASHILAGVTAGLVFERVVLLGGWAFLSSVFSASRHRPSARRDTHQSSLVFGGVRQSLFLGMFLLIFVVLIRLVSRRLWVADVLGSFVFSVLGIGLISPIAGP